MIKRILKFGLMIFLIGVVSGASWAVPQMISFSGRLTSQGQALSEPGTQVVFSMPNWTETWTTVSEGTAPGAGQMVIDGSGVFNVTLGSQNPIPDSIFDSDNVNLDISVNNTSMGSQRMVSVPYAFKAQNLIGGSVNARGVPAVYGMASGTGSTADDAAGVKGANYQLDIRTRQIDYYGYGVEGIGKVGVRGAGPTAGQFDGNVRITSGMLIFPDGSRQSTAAGVQWVPSGDNIYREAGNVGIGTMSPAAKLQVSGGNVIFDDRVGIGVTSPTAKLQVDGGSGYGIIGSSSGLHGIYGFGPNTGVKGESTSGTGVSGSSDGGYGTVGFSSSFGTNAKAGVYGNNNASSNGGPGVYGQSNTGYGVYGKGHFGGVFESVDQNNAIRINSNSGNNESIYAWNTGTGGKGVFGFGDARGVHGRSSSNGSGVYAENSTMTGAALEVNGRIKVASGGDSWTGGSGYSSVTINKAAGTASGPLNGGVDKYVTISNTFVRPDSQILVTVVGDSSFHFIYGVYEQGDGFFRVRMYASTGIYTTAKIHFLVIN